MQVIPKAKNNYVHLNVYGHRVQVEINNSRPNVFSIGIGGYLSINDEENMQGKINRLRLNVRRKVSEQIPQLFSIKNNKYIVVFDFAEDSLITKVSPYFSLDITLFCVDKVQIKEPLVIDTIQVFSELILEYLYDNQDFTFNSKKMKSNLSYIN